MKIKYTQHDKNWMPTKEKLRLEKNRGNKTRLTDFTKKEGDKNNCEANIDRVLS